MSQTSQLLASLKQCLRAKGHSYRDVAQALDLSESSVKRLFSEQSFSLQRLEQVCHFLDMSLYDLTKLAAAREGPLDDRLTVEQEEALAEDPVLLSYFYLLLVGWAPMRAGQRVGLDKHGQTRYLARLDRLKLIELYPNNRVRLRTRSHITWAPDGPIRQRYEAQVKRAFVGLPFDKSGEILRLESSELSDASIKVLMRRIESLVRYFEELTEMDKSLPKEDKKAFGIMIAGRPWTFWDIVGPMSKKDS